MVSIEYLLNEMIEKIDFAKLSVYTNSEKYNNSYEDAILTESEK